MPTHRSACRFVLLLLLSSLAAAQPAEASTFSLFGFAAAGAVHVESQPSWLAGGFGRLSTGAARVGAAATDVAAQGRLGVLWEPTVAWQLRASGLLRAEPDSRGGAAGLTEVFLQWTHGLEGARELRLRLGLFFLPTSREAVDPLWTTPYTLTLSALNTWIGEEVRPSGVDAACRFGEHLSVGGTVFGGNDTAGALLAWRGWAMGQRVSLLGEALPLPPLLSLADPAAFADQRTDGTEPVGNELDGHAGWSARARLEGAGALLQGSVYDNGGDRGLHRGEYAWRTRTVQLAAQLERGPWVLVGEGLRGASGMGRVYRPHVDIDFWAFYVLASLHRGPWRLSARYDNFYTEDRDRSAAENNNERGWAWTVAGFWQPAERWRLGLEWLHLKSERPAAAQSGGNANTDGNQWQLEARFNF